MAEDSKPEFPLFQRDHAPGAIIEETTVFQLQYRDEDGRWISWLTPDSDRPKITRIQTHRLQDPAHQGERRRVLGRKTIDFVVEIEGDGDGETTAEELLARNKADTERLLQADKQQQPDT